MFSVRDLVINDKPEYVLVSDGKLVELPCKYLKYLSTIKSSSNTQKAYAYGLKAFSTFLEGKSLRYEDVSMKELYEFNRWLQDPNEGTNILAFKKNNTVRSPKTVNLYIAAVLSFYKYLYEFGIYDNNLSQYHTENKAITPKYKDFLYHIHTGEGVKLNKLYVKEKKKKIEVLQQEEVRELIQAANNTRDKFLLYLLFVSGLRIGEALSLYNEDIIYDHAHGHRIMLKDRDIIDIDHQQKTGTRSVFINQECMDLYDDYQYEMLDILNKDSDYVFVKLSGENKGEPMSYDDVHSLFIRLNKKTGITVTPHVIRHTHATIYYEETKDPKALQERLGHSNIQTTMNMYVHPSRKTMLDEWNTAQKRFNNNSGKPHDK